MTTCRFLAIVCIVAVLLLGASGEQCGKQANDTLCPNDLCCSEYGWCGDTAHYCCKNCQSQCDCGPVADIISDSLFEEMLEKLFSGRCPEAYGFYTYGYDDFIDAAKSFEEFGTTGNMTIRKQELAAFLAQTSQETSDGHSGEPFDWGYCIIRERDPPSDYCVNNTEWPCVEGQSYYGRGPIQLRYNYNYGPAGKALGLDLLSKPDLVATDPLVSFETAIWFWMNPHGSKPAPHAVITGQWVPSDNDLQFGRHPGYGVITNIINGRKECGQGPNPVASNRIGYYKRYCDMLEVGYGDNLDCDNQEPFDPAEFQQLQTF